MSIEPYTTGGATSAYYKRPTRQLSQAPAEAMTTLERTINDLDADAAAALARHLSEYVSPERSARIDRVLGERTRFVTVMLENVYRSHNASAVVRSCECFGVQDLHVVESSNAFDVSRGIVQGAAKWVTVHRHRESDACLRGLKAAGYRVVALSLEPGAVPVEQLPLDVPTVLCLGSEEPGLTRQARSLADTAAAIPMQGFTQSLNLSVTAGIALQGLTGRLRRSKADWQLAPAEQAGLRALWLARSINAGREIVHRYLDAAAG